MTFHDISHFIRVADVARAALTERSGSSTKGRTPNIRYFVAKLSIVAMYALFERLSQGFRRAFQRKPSFFHRALNKSHPVFIELSTKVILLSKSSWRDCFWRTCFLTIFSATIEMDNSKFFNKFVIYDILPSLTIRRLQAELCFKNDKQLWFSQSCDTQCPCQVNFNFISIIWSFDALADITFFLASSHSTQGGQLRRRKVITCAPLQCLAGYFHINDGHL